MGERQATNDSLARTIAEEEAPNHVRRPKAEPGGVINPGFSTDPKEVKKKARQDPNCCG